MANTYKFKRETKNGSLIINDGTSDGLKKALINAVSNPTSTTAITVVSFYPNNTFGIDLSTETVQIWDGTAYVTVTGAEAICLQLNATVLFKTVGGDTSTPGTTLSGENYVFVNSDGTVQGNGDTLLTAYESAKLMTPNGVPLSATNRLTLLLAPGRYDTDPNLILNTPFIDVSSLTGNIDVLIAGNLNITADNIIVRGLKCGTITLLGNLPNIILENCIGGINSFGYNVEVNGTFINCTGGDGSFGAIGGTASGTFENCTGGLNSFGSGGTASGTFENCTGGLNSFGGGGQGTASGTFENCTGGLNSFGGGGTASGTFENCTGGLNSFGGQGTASGTFENCTGGDASFGGGGTTSGTFENCTGGVSSFGSGGTITATARLYYCRITGGSNFLTVTAGGITRYCINGDNTTDNQG